MTMMTMTTLFRRTTHFLAALAAIVLVTAACGSSSVSTSSDDPTTTVPESGYRFGGDWDLVGATIDGQPLDLLADWPVTLLIRGGEVSGRAACNSYFGTMNVDGLSISITDVGQTEMGCEPEVMDLESSYLRALMSSTRIDGSDDELTLSSDTSTLTFTRQVPPPTADLLGTTWILDTLIDGDSASSVHAGAAEATLVLTDEATVTGSTGCRDLSGAYTVVGNSFLFTEFAATGDCPDDLRQQDDHVVTVLGDGFEAAIEGQRLTLTAAGGIGLSYRAE